MRSRPSLSTRRRLLLSFAILPLILATAVQSHAPTISHVAAAVAADTPTAMATGTPTVVTTDTPTAVVSATGTVTPTATVLSTETPTATATTTSTVPTTGTAGSGIDTSTLLSDELDLLNIPELTTAVPMSTLPPIKGSVAGLERQIVGLIGRVNSSSLSTTDKAALLNQLENLNTQLAPAPDLQDTIDTLRGQENLLVQSRVDAQAAIDNLNAQIQVNLDQLRANVEVAASVDVSATLGSITVTVTGGADTIQAQLGAQTNRLLVNVVTDLDVLHIATLHATANVDTSRLNVTLTALVKKLRLDLRLLITALSVSIHSDVAAAIAAEASLTVSLAAEVDGLKANLAANTDAKISGLDALLTKRIHALNHLLSTTSRSLQGMRSQVR